jgi:peptide/nickel transport system substrate-binding protein
VCTFLAVVSTSTALSGCGRSDQRSEAKTPDTVALRLGVAAPSGSVVTSFANAFTSEPLVGIGWDGRPVDRIVSAWEWTDDRLKLRLRLRPNVRFHDGSPFDLAQLKQTLETAFKERSGNVSYKSVKSVDTDSGAPEWVNITLTRPEAFLLTDLGNSFLRHPSDQHIGTGPYRLESSSGKPVLKAFDQYYRGRPKIDSIEIEPFGDQRASWAALMRGEIDAVHEIAPNAVDFVQAEGQTNVRTYAFLRPYYLQLAFNVRHPVLKNPAVRQALSYGLDRQAVVDHALNKQGTVAEGPIWPFHWAYSTAQKTYTHNSEAATLRLDSAGLAIRKSPTGRMPSRLHIVCLTVANNAQFEKIALVLQKQLYEIGVDLEIQALPIAELMKRLEAGDFETVLIQRTTGRSLAWTYLTFHSSQSVSGYKAADRVLDRLRQTTSETEIRALVGDLQQVLHDDPPAIFIAWPKVARGVSSRFQVPDETGRDVLSSLWQWRRAEPPGR